MSTQLNNIVVKIKKSNNKEKLNKLIEDYQPFVLNVITETKNGYVDVNNDEEFTIGLMAFHEAFEKFDENRGDFLSYARLVIESRLKTYWSSESKNPTVELSETDIVTTGFDETVILKQEIEAFQKVLKAFGLSFDALAKSSPKHEDTINRAKDIGVKAAKENDFVNHLYIKKRLPIKPISDRFKITVKIIKHSKSIIMATMIVITEKYQKILEWIS